MGGIILLLLGMSSYYFIYLIFPDHWSGTNGRNRTHFGPAIGPANFGQRDEISIIELKKAFVIYFLVNDRRTRTKLYQLTRKTTSNAETQTDPIRSTHQDLQPKSSDQ